MRILIGNLVLGQTKDFLADFETGTIIFYWIFWNTTQFNGCDRTRVLVLGSALDFLLAKCMIFVGINLVEPTKMVM